jgi:catabolite regulation protein CreA
VTNVRARGWTRNGIALIPAYNDLSDVVGNTTTFGNVDIVGNNHITVNASFDDGSNQIILDTWV